MKNLLRMNFYRLLRTRGVWICTGIGIVYFTILSGLMAYFVTKMTPELNDESIDITTAVLSDVPGGIFLFFAVIAICIHMGTERGGGFIKNIAGAGKRRSDCFLANLISVSAYVFFLLIVDLLLYGITMMIAVPKQYTFSGANLIKGIPCLLIQFVMIMGFLSIVMALEVLSNLMVVSITAGIILEMGIADLVVSMMSGALGFDFSKILIVTGIKNVTPEATALQMGHGIGLGILYLLVFVIFSVLWMNKRDAI